MPVGGGRWGTRLADLLPAAVEVSETTLDVPESRLLPEERAAVAKAVASRRAEFATVRDCARRALGRLGHPAVAILPGPNREPLWPPGVVGSLTHCAGYRAAAVARAGEIWSLGIDAEPNEPLDRGVTELITVAAEPGLLTRLALSRPGISWERVLFSAKESIYKTWFPLTGRWLGFTECELDIQPDTGRFTGRLLVPGFCVGGHRIEQFSGRWAVHGGHIVTAVVQPAPEVLAHECPNSP